MKTLFAAKRDEAERAPFDVLIEQAVELHRELAKPGRYNDIRAQRLSKPAALAESLRNARCNEQRIQEVTEILAAEGEGSTRYVNAFIGEVRKRLSVLAEYQGAASRPPRDGLDGILGPGAYNALIAECTNLDIKPLELIVLSVQQTPEESFGDLVDADQHVADVATKNEKLHELYTQASEAITLSDLQFVPVDAQQGIFRRIFKLGGGIAATEPLPAAIEVLVGQLAKQ